MRLAELTGRVAIIDGAEWQEWQTTTSKHQQRYYRRGGEIVFVLPRGTKITLAKRNAGL